VLKPAKKKQEKFPLVIEEKTKSEGKVIIIKPEKGTLEVTLNEMR
jgi:hypothetical protein